MIIVALFMNNKTEKICFFEDIFLLANISIDVVLMIYFFTLSNADIQFTYQELHQKSYTAAHFSLTIYYIEFISCKKFADATLNKNKRIFVVYMASLGSCNKDLKISIYLFCNAQLALFIINKALIAISFKYFDYTNMISPESTAEFSE